MRTLTVLIAISSLLLGCSEKAERKETPEGTEPPKLEVPSPASSPITFEQIEDNVKHDTLLIQTTFDLTDGTYLMVASHTLAEERLDEGDRSAGLRLYHYRVLPDSTADIIARSSSARDSWTMFPTFFKDPSEDGSYIVLANFGDRSSWGQKVIRFNAQGFADLGFLNVAAIERTRDGDEEVMKLLNIAPHTRISSEGNELVFTFEVEDLLLYDDLRGVLQQPIDADRIAYRWSEAEGMRLFIDQQIRVDEQPS